MINKVGIIDTETSGLNHKKGNLLEIGLIIYDFQSKSILHQISTLLFAVSNEAEKINNISVNSLKNIISECEFTLTDSLVKLINSCDLLIAHNASFDKNWLVTHNKFENIFNKKWVCSKNDIKWRGIGSLSLKNISQKMGIINNSAHRALGDCQTLLSCLLKLDNFEEQIIALYKKFK